MMRPQIYLALIFGLLGLAQGQHELSCQSRCDCYPPQDPITIACESKSLKVMPHDLPPSVTQLSLQNNELRSVESLIGAYHELTHLDLSKNKIKTVERGSFGSLRNLAFLDLSDNELSILTGDSFRGLFALTEVSLANNNLENLPSALFSNSIKLETVHLQGNRLTFLPSVMFDGVSNLQSLNLARNEFTEVPASQGKSFQHLGTLIMDLNPLEALTDGAFVDMPRLRTLSLFGCQLESLDYANLKPLSELRDLNVAKNELNVFPGYALSALIELTRLRIGLNPFPGFDEDSLSGLTRLETLEIVGCSGNEFLVPQTAFKHPTSLRELNISSCWQLQLLHQKTLTHLPYLKTLGLAKNGLKGIPDEFAHLGSLSVFDLTDNPLHCGCEMYWLRDLYRAKISRREIAIELVPQCYSPQELRHRTLSNITDHEICPDGFDNFVTEGPGSDTNESDMSTVIIVILSVILVIALIAIGVSLWCCLYKKKGCYFQCWRDRPTRSQASHKRSKWRKKRASITSKNDIEVIPAKVGQMDGYFDVVQPLNMYNGSDKASWILVENNSSDQKADEDESFYEKIDDDTVIRMQERLRTRDHNSCQMQVSEL